MNTPRATDTRHWRSASDLFDELIDLPLPQQGERLAALEKQDPALAVLVRELLDADARADAMIDVPAGHFAPEVITDLAAPPRELPAHARYQQIGPYKVLGSVGQGGMGDVLLAERCDGQYEQQVAIKVLKRGMDSERVLKRFLQERRILARLSHANIARLLDGGMTPDELPYFVMEYVEGQPITAFADAWHLTLRQRVELMRHVAETVEYAHRNLVVHRDLKPSNILVDGSGGLKLLDFGIAKVLTGDAEDDAAMTETGTRIMTPAYAAPEQILGQPVTTATDVYALGVLLFELLTGRLPHRRVARAPSALADELSQESIEEPSAALRHTDPSIAAGAARERRRRARELEGDLDTIVMTALKREPERRYRSASAFADDLVRWLDGRPITARRDSRWYRAGKFVSRHRVGVATAFAAFAALLTGLGMALWQAEAAGRSAARAEAEARRAELQAQRAQLTKDFLIDIIGQANPFDTSRGPELSAAALLETAETKLDQALAEAPEAQAELRAAIAQSLFRLGGPTKSMPLIDRAVADARAIGGEMLLKLPDMLSIQATIHNEGGDHDGAEAAAREALQLMQKLPGDWGALRISAQTTLARVASQRGRAREAYALYQSILRERIARVGAEHADVAMDHQNLAASELMMDRFTDAEASYRRAEAILTRLLGNEHPRLSYIWHGWGLALMKLGRYDEADAMLARSLALKRRVLKPTHPGIATTMQVQAQVSYWAGKYEQAQQRLVELEAATPPGDPSQVLPYGEWTRARLALATGRPAEAATAARKALAAIAPVRGADDPSTLDVEALAGYAAWRARPDDVVALGAAETALTAVLERLQRSATPSGEEIAEVAQWLADIKRSRGDTGAAKALHERSVAAYRELFGLDHPRTRTATHAR